MNRRNKKESNSTDEIKQNLNTRPISTKQEQKQTRMTNAQSIPMKQTSTQRSCLKHQSKRQSDISPENLTTGRSSIGTGRVSFAHATLNDGKLLLPTQSQNDFIDKKHRSDLFARKAKELQLAELTYFKDHAQDKEPMDE